MSSLSMIYSFIAREQVVLTDYTSESGNFSQVALEVSLFFIQVLSKTNFSKTFGQYATANYCFYTFIKDRFVFLVMVKSSVIIFLVSMKQELQSVFSKRYKNHFLVVMTNKKEAQQLLIH